MILQDYKIEGDSITITKQEMQEASDHYYKVADTFSLYKDDEPRMMFYLGKADVLNDILKMFEPLEQ